MYQGKRRIKTSNGTRQRRMSAYDSAKPNQTAKAFSPKNKNNKLIQNQSHNSTKQADIFEIASTEIINETEKEDQPKEDEMFHT